MENTTCTCCNCAEVKDCTCGCTCDCHEADHVLCTDISNKMLKVARRKARRSGIQNITFEHRNIFALDEPDNSFDVVIAGQVLHLIDDLDIGEMTAATPA